MQAAEIVWNKAKESLKEKMTDIGYNTWIADVVPVSLGEDEMVLLAKNEIVKNTLKNIYYTVVIDEVNRANGSPLTITFVDPSEDEKLGGSRKTTLPCAPMLNPKYTFDTFVIGNSNSFAHAAAKAVAENPSTAYNPLFIYGGVGLGKTHLMHAIGHHICQRNPSSKIIYVTSEAFTNEVIDAIREDKRNRLRNKYRNADVLMVDDVQFISGRVSTQEEFFNTFNALYTLGKQIILTSDKPPMEITTLEERLRSRFEGGLITDIQQPDIETRIAILKKKAMLENISISEDVFTFIAEKVVSNIRQLEGSLTRVIAFSNLTKRPITTALADVALKDIIPGYEHKKITIELIQQVVADYYAIDIDGLSSQRRTMELTLPRQVAMHMCKKFTDCSYKTIGKSFGGRDHSTVINACNKIEGDIKVNDRLRTAVEDIEKRLKQ